MSPETSIADPSSTPLATTPRASAPGKVILLGEHAVVYGRSAIAAAITPRVVVTLIPSIGPAHFENEDDPRLAPALARALQMTGGADDGFTVRVESNLPRAAGLGSSAALSVALIRALAARIERPIAITQLSALAFEIETIFHGTPSGIDNCVVAYGGLIAFRRRGDIPEVWLLRAARPLPLVVALGRAPRETRRAVAALRTRWHAAPQSYESLFDEIDWLVTDAEQAIGRGDLIELGTLMNTNHGLLHALEVSTNELEQMVALARAHGALGAKLTGGGGGGAVICLCPDGREQLVRAFAKAGWRAFSTDITDEATRGVEGQHDACGNGTITECGAVARA
ncbi:MAG: mevalonate kinase [Deltaproteobacteria bacterium]|nr:mevalonate kinase [Deltaproteobacteria bacterium]MBI3388486.1 mevalonate kinase [Deltaproteobacteria bacterium]